MKIKTIPSSWIIQEEHRLDCGPYTSGRIETRKQLESLPCVKQRLCDLTMNGINGIYHVGQEKLRWVDSEEHGVPFLTSSDILKMDLSKQPFIAKEQVLSNSLFQCPSGSTLVTRSGTIGRTVYARDDLAEMAISQDVLKIVPDESKVAPGYLFAFLSSRFGVPLLVGGTFGSIIVHIEAENIADMPIPRLGQQLESKIHENINESASLRTAAGRELSSVAQVLLDTLDISPIGNSDVSSFGITSVDFRELNCRLDAPYHSNAAREAEKSIRESSTPFRSLTEVLRRNFKPPMFKRIWVEGPEFGRQFVSGTDAYRYSAEEPRFVSYRTPNFDEFILQRGWVVFQAAGQIYGLFGRPLFVLGWLEQIFCADDIYRLVPHTEEDGAYLYAFFRTPHGQALLKRQACGNSIPRVWDPHMEGIIVPWPADSIRNRLAEPVIRCHQMIERARVLEEDAIALVETAIQGAL